MAIKKLNYTGDSKILKRLCETVNSLIDGGGGGGSKHTIINSSGTDMAARAGLQFTGATVTDDSVNDKTVVAIPTKLSDFINDTNFITSTVSNLTNYYLKSETYTKAEVDSMVSAITALNILVVQTLPTQDISTTTIYLVPKQTPETQDVYDEYIYINNAWEHIGTTQIDLSNYYTKAEVNALIPTIDSTLSTTSENPVQNRVITARLNEVFQSVSNGKTLIASAITGKGVPTDATDTFATMASNISNIPSGEAPKIMGGIFELVPLRAFGGVGIGNMATIVQITE